MWHAAGTLTVRNVAIPESFVVLDELLDGDLENDPSTVRGLTNHLPMALVAKAALGAPPEELRRFASKYETRLRPRSGANRELTRSTWRRALGEPAAYSDLDDFFGREISARGVDDTVRTYMDELMAGVSAAAFHGPIRLSYALDAASPSRVGSALAYFAANAAPLAPLETVEKTTDSPEAILSLISNEWRGGSVPSLPLISDEMHWAARQPSFTRLVSSLSVDDRTPQRLADAALKLYATTDDFTALHGVTGLEALARIRPCVDDVSAFDRFSFQALAAAYLAIGAPPVWSRDRLDEFASSTTLEQSEVQKRGAMSDDEHVAKLVFSAQRLHASKAEPLYLAIAERAAMNDRSVPTTDARDDDA